MRATRITSFLLCGIILRALFVHLSPLRWLMHPTLVSEEAHSLSVYVLMF